MEWYYALNDEQQGPVTDARLDDLLRAGTVTSDTPVWHKELTDWQPLSVARAAARAAADSLAPLPTARCVECGDIFAHQDMLTLNNSWICIPCKPKFLQRTMAGVSMSASLGIIWRKNRDVVLAHGTAFPDRCVCCNAPTDGSKFKRELWWHPPVYYLLAILPPIYLIFAMLVRKRAVLQIGLCEAHRAAHKRTIFIASLAAISGFLLLLAAAIIGHGWMALAGLFLLAGAGIYSAIQASIITVTQIDPNLVSFKGAGQPFLDTLPEWTAPKPSAAPQDVAAEVTRL